MRHPQEKRYDVSITYADSPYRPESAGFYCTPAFLEYEIIRYGKIQNRVVIKWNVHVTTP